jgi:hypothetical protein
LQEGHEAGEGSQLGPDEMATNDEAQESDSGSETSSDSSEDSGDDSWTSSDEIVDESATADVRMEEFQSIMQSAMDIFNEQRKKGNMKFIEKFMAANEMNRTLVEEINRMRKRHTMPRTWAKNRHPATFYYK